MRQYNNFRFKRLSSFNPYLVVQGTTHFNPFKKPEGSQFWPEALFQENYELKSRNWGFSPSQLISKTVKVLFWYLPSSFFYTDKQNSVLPTNLLEVVNPSAQNQKWGPKLDTVEPEQLKSFKYLGKKFNNSKGLDPR